MSSREGLLPRRVCCQKCRYHQGRGMSPSRLCTHHADNQNFSSAYLKYVERAPPSPFSRLTRQNQYEWYRPYPRSTHARDYWSRIRQPIQVIKGYHRMSLWVYGLGRLQSLLTCRPSVISSIPLEALTPKTLHLGDLLLHSHLLLSKVRDMLSFPCDF